MDQVNERTQQKLGQKSRTGPSGNTGKTTKEWLLISCLGIIVLFAAFIFLAILVSESQMQSKAEEIVALGKTDADKQQEKLADADDPLLNTVEKLDSELANTERERRKAEEVKAIAETVKAGAAKEKAKYRETLEREIQSMRQNPTMTDDDDVIQDEVYVTVNAALLATRAKLLAEAPYEIKSETENLRQEYIKLHKAYQRDTFPKLRQMQAKIWRNKLWENNVEVRVSGSKADRITFTAAMFASNRNKSAMQETVLPTLKLLRFRRASYEWYRGSQAPYWDLETLADGEIATIDSQNNWRPIKN
ncbi:MAG: hypothetical protein ABJN65_17230 [Parasphingorhabdus sp.]